MKYNKKRVITENFAEVVRRGVSQDPGSSEDTKHTRRAEKHLLCLMIITNTKSTGQRRYPGSGTGHI